MEVRKKFITTSSANDGEFETSTATWAPASTSARPSPVSVLTPESGDAGTASCPCSRSMPTSFEPIKPVPPTMTIFVIVPSVCVQAGPGERLSAARTGHLLGL